MCRKYLSLRRFRWEIWSTFPTAEIRRMEPPRSDTGKKLTKQANPKPDQRPPRREGAPDTKPTYQRRNPENETTATRPRKKTHRGATAAARAPYLAGLRSRPSASTGYPVGRSYRSGRVIYVIRITSSSLSHVAFARISCFRVPFSRIHLFRAPFGHRTFVL